MQNAASHEQRLTVYFYYNNSNKQHKKKIKHETRKHTFITFYINILVAVRQAPPGLLYRRCWGVDWTRLMGDICPGCLSVRVKYYRMRGQRRNSTHTQKNTEWRRTTTYLTPTEVRCLSVWRIHCTVHVTKCSADNGVGGCVAEWQVEYQRLENSATGTAVECEFPVNPVQLLLCTGRVGSTSLPGYNYCCVSSDLGLAHLPLLED